LGFGFFSIDLWFLMVISVMKRGIQKQSQDVQDRKTMRAQNGGTSSDDVIDHLRRKSMFHKSSAFHHLSLESRLTSQTLSNKEVRVSPTHT
jgi:ribosomal protein S20